MLAAFGAAASEPVRLPGGGGVAWRAGSLVLKPVEFAAETLWRAEILARLPESAEFRVARPARARNGQPMAHGWEASQYVPGEPDVSRPDDILRAGAAFHAATASIPRPAFLDRRDDPWSYADRVAWDELPVRTGPAARALLEPLLAARDPVAITSQVVHGDLAGNVLFADGLPPAIIDWPAYWRPTSWACAVIVADALCWHGAPPELAARWSHLPCWGQMLVRALIYRIVTDEACLGPAGWTTDRTGAYRPVVDLAVSYAMRRHPAGDSPGGPRPR